MCCGAAAGAVAGWRPHRARSGWTGVSAPGRDLKARVRWEGGWLMPAPDRSRALEHIVVALFENRSLDNVLGHLYGPGDGKDFDGVIGKDLSNPIPPWAEHGADRQVVPYTVATDMDSPNPDSGEEYFHTNTQLFNILDV